MYTSVLVELESWSFPFVPIALLLHSSFLQKSCLFVNIIGEVFLIDVFQSMYNLPAPICLYKCNDLEFYEFCHDLYVLPHQ